MSQVFPVLTLCKWKGLWQWTCAKIPGELGQTGKTGLFCLWSQAGGWAALQLWEDSLQNREEASGGMWRVSSSGMSEHTDSQQANGSVPYFQWKIFQLQFFCFINIFLRSFFIFWIKGNHPWHNNGWILSWKSQFPLNAPCSSSRHFPTKGSEISAVPVCAPDEF